MKSGTVWSFKTARFGVYLNIEQDEFYKFDGDDENGETQRGLDSGELVAFDSTVTVELDGEEIASDSLGGNVYGKDDYSDFWKAHRGSDPMDRNCEAFRAAHGRNAAICHCFPDMVRTAISEARKELQRRAATMPKLREVVDVEYYVV